MYLRVSYLRVSLVWKVWGLGVVAGFRTFGVVRRIPGLQLIVGDLQYNDVVKRKGLGSTFRV